MSWRLRRRLACFVLGGCALVVVACGSVDRVADPGAREAAAVAVGRAVSCAAQTPAEERARARVIVDAVARGGRVDPLGVLLSPARFRVLRYLKGRGPRRLRVQTQVTVGGGGYSYGEDGIAPRAGQRWRLYGRRTREARSPRVSAPARAG